VLFVCPSLEPGRDGVGDYTRRLAAELQRCGHDCLCVALNDRHCSVSASMADPDGKCPSLLRLSSSVPWSSRWAKLDALVREFQPHWLSVQFVPWGFHIKGLPYSLGARMRRIAAGAHVHVMCHELWIQGRAFSIKQRILGVFQKWAITRLFAVLQPRVVNTTLEYYRDLLSAIGVSATLLPLHGNIPISSSRAEGRAWLRSRLGLDEHDQCLGFFGEIHAAVDNDALAELLRQRQMHPGNVVILSAGQLTLTGSEVWHRITSACSGLAKSFTLGCFSKEDVSKYLRGLDVGLTSYPREYVGKSGGVAAMLEHSASVCLLGARLSGAPFSEEGLQFLGPEQGRSVSATASSLIELFTMQTETDSSAAYKQRVSL
jgi:hypothetical protein